eukprot:CAMPEP_0181330548 /NCGR_PEP_ID=MMETSP1101-20121128/23962_1 /TAXON_ID=46948 /ORGANISM="Rhodomonas abbreviata, Strain Caron Lab Isolate" /LENGTH=122 /DNA_ID=CAMNT_0023439819 /DNA_START=205 /DNA_END=570 /DNA_ORIENTATION=+
MYSRVPADDMESLAQSGTSDITGIELGSIAGGIEYEHGDRRGITSSLLSNTLIGITVAVGAVFLVHALVEAYKPAPPPPKHHHHWEGTASVSNNVRLEVDKPYNGLHQRGGGGQGGGGGGGG